MSGYNTTISRIPTVILRLVIIIILGYATAISWTRISRAGYGSSSVTVDIQAAALGDDQRNEQYPICSTPNEFAAGDDSESTRLLKICVADLPDEFTSFWTVMLNETDQYHRDSFAAAGYGEPAEPGNELVRHTHQFTLGLLMHESLRQSPLFTTNCEEADAVFVFYDVSIQVYVQSILKRFDFPFSTTKLSPETLFGENRSRHLPYLASKPHFFPLSKCELDFKQCSPGVWNESQALEVKSFLCHDRVYDNMIFWTIEKQWQKSRLQSLAVPYPSHTHYQHSATRRTHVGPVDLVEQSVEEDCQEGVGCRDGASGQVNNRDLFAFGTWNNRITWSHIRPNLTTQCEARPDECVFYPASGGPVNFSDAEAARYYQRAVYCLQPPGDTPTRSSFWDAIVNGCVNVIFNSKIHWPYARWFNWDKLFVYIDPDRLKTENIVDILKMIPATELAVRQAYIAESRHAFQYALDPAWETVTPETLSILDPRDDAHTLALKDAFLTVAEILPLARQEPRGPHRRQTDTRWGPPAPARDDGPAPAADDAAADRAPTANAERPRQ